jgi:serine protease Do/serine protease DegQ
VIREATVAAPRIIESDGATLHPKLAGLKLRDVQDPNGGAGVLIDQMNTASYAYQVGLKPGDVIVAANRKPTESTKDLQHAVKGTREILLNVMRGQQGLIVVLR